MSSGVQRVLTLIVGFSVTITSFGQSCPPEFH
jgi:hypothetical protein